MISKFQIASTSSQLISLLNFPQIMMINGSQSQTLDFLFLENAGNLEQRLIWNTPNGGAG
jgi:hypothetical protein